MAYPADIDKAVALAFARADVIFVGSVEAMRTNFLRFPQTREMDFRIRTTWKGPNEDRAKVRTNVGEIACGYKFKKRGIYLVFAYRDRNKDILTTSFCDLNRREAAAGDAIKALNRIATSKHPRESNADT